MAPAQRTLARPRPSRLLSAAMTADDGVRPPGGIRGPGERILVVDDNPENLASLGELLRLAGTRSTVLRDGRRDHGGAPGYRRDRVLRLAPAPHARHHRGRRRVRAEAGLRSPGAAPGEARGR